MWYLGQRYADQDVPWHYPSVMFLVTVPAGLLVLGALGLFAHDREDKTAFIAPREALLLVSMLFPLFVFSWPGIAVYDGARLFLSVFGLWACLWERGLRSYSCGLNDAGRGTPPS